MMIPSQEDVRDCFRDFRGATSNDRLRMEECGVCGREVATCEGKYTEVLNDADVREVLHPVDEHPAYDMWKGALVTKGCMKQLEREQAVWICLECENMLVKKKLPPLALANDLWIGQVPVELSALTIPEQLMIARHYPRCYVFKLYPREATHMGVDQMQRGMKGNVSLYDVNTKEVVKMLEGQKMPNPTSTLASVVVVTVIGSKKLPKDWLKATFQIRRKRVYEALMWLRKNNALYEDIVIDEERLQMLPEDGIPVEIMASIRHDENEAVAEKEREGVVMEDVTEGKLDDVVRLILFGLIMLKREGPLKKEMLFPCNS
jgi:hypothetical protein